MADVDRAPVAGAKHDWRDRKTYEHSCGWAPERWAWEFLRRNAEFRAAIAGANDSLPDDASAAAAARWGLVTFGPGGRRRR